MKKNNQIILRPIRPNIGLEVEYQRRLEKLIDDMHKSIKYHLLRAYKSHEPEMAQDASPATFLKSVMNKLARIWLKRFDEAADVLAKHFSKSTQDRTDSSLKSALRDTGFTVKFDQSRAMNDVVQATINQQVSLIKSIAEKHLSDVEGLVMRSVQSGRDLGGLADELQKRYGLTRYRASLIAKNQNNVATSMMNRVRQKELGITKAIWMHSGAGKKPRPSHVKANGEEYDIERGAFIDGEYIFPGQLINCRCQSRSVISTI